MSVPSPQLADGCLRIDESGDLIHPGMTGSDFEQLAIVKENGYKSGTYTATVTLGIKHVAGQAFTLAFVFQKGRMSAVELYYDFEDPAKDKPWDYAIELERKKAHEDWCRQMLGRPLEPMKGYEKWERQAEVQHLLEYAWGSIRSIYDSKAGFSYLALRYDDPALRESAAH